MGWKNSTARYGSALITLHWLTLALLVVVYALIDLREIYPSGSPPREAMKAWHFTLGLAVFALVWLRLALRLTQQNPRIVPTPVQWQARLATVVHVALYILMGAMPLLGWLALSAAGETTLANGLALPPLIAPNAASAETFEEIHEVIGKAGYALIFIHAAAALFHHYVLRDNTLTRILPFQK